VWATTTPGLVRDFFPLATGAAADSNAANRTIVARARIPTTLDAGVITKRNLFAVIFAMEIWKILESSPCWTEEDKLAATTNFRVFRAGHQVLFRCAI
jgi:hypothetical protein